MRIVITNRRDSQTPKGGMTENYLVFRNLALYHFEKNGASDGARTRDLRRDRPAL